MGSTPKASASAVSANRVDRPGSTPGRVRILIVDDSVFMRRALTELIATDPALEIIDTAKDGREGLEKAKSLRPDVITLDIEMPVMDGLEALRAIRRECPRPRPAVLVCSTLTSAGSSAALKALCAGAADVILKDFDPLGRQGSNGGNAGSGQIMRAGLIAKIKAIAEHRHNDAPGAAAAGRPASVTPPALAVRPRLSASQFNLLVIGSSTGGPPVLETIINALPKDFPWPVVVAQHMPAMFTQSMAARLAETAKIKVVHGSDGAPVLPGVAYIGPGGEHVRVRALGDRYRLEVSPEPRQALYKPSVDELVTSAAGAAGRRGLAVIVTGMGDDGRLGCQKLHAAGGMVLAQNAETCVVYGMPRAVVEAGVVTAALSPEDLAGVLSSVKGSAAKAA